MTSLLKQGVTHLLQHGPKSTYQSGRTALYNRIIGGLIFDADGDQLSSLACTSNMTESKESMTVTYHGNQPIPACLRRRIGKIEIPPRQIYELRDTEIIGGSDLIYTNGIYIATATVGATEPQNNLACRSFTESVGIKRALIDRMTTGPGTKLPLAFVLAGRKNQYAQWFYETLPKLRAFDAHKQHTAEEPTLVVSVPQLRSWQRESLRLLGYSRDSYIEHTKGRLRAKKVLVPSHRLRRGGGEFVPSSSDLRWLQKQIKPRIDSTSKYSSRLYVSRADADRRTVRNESAVLDTLRSLGFEKVIPGQLPYEEQVRAFTDAEVIVGPHGAGLTNMLYATDATVVELLTGEGPTPHYFLMANELNFEYECCLCEPVEREDMEARHWDMIVDPAELRALLNSVLNAH